MFARPGVQLQGEGVTPFLQITAILGLSYFTPKIFAGYCPWPNLSGTDLDVGQGHDQWVPLDKNTWS